MLPENDLWILSFYRASEITGALFFGRLARSLKPNDIQRDLTKHFCDEACHAWYWTECIERLNAKPLKLPNAYQDKYLEAAGIPVNMMEVLAVTQVFEQRVISQYSIHRQVPGLQPEIKETIERIMRDERWHIEWVGAALAKMEKKYGTDLVESTLHRFRQADRQVYKKTVDEHGQRIQDLMKLRRR